MSRGSVVANILATDSSWQTEEYAQMVLECEITTARFKTSKDHDINIPKVVAAQWTRAKCICQVSCVLRTLWVTASSVVTRQRYA